MTKNWLLDGRWLKKKIIRKCRTCLVMDYPIFLTSEVNVYRHKKLFDRVRSVVLMYTGG